MSMIQNEDTTTTKDHKMAKQKKEEYQPTEEDIMRMTRLTNCLLDMVIEDQKLPPEERKFHIIDNYKE